VFEAGGELDFALEAPEHLIRVRAPRVQQLERDLSTGGYLLCLPDHTRATDSPVQLIARRPRVSMVAHSVAADEEILNGVGSQ